MESSFSLRSPYDDVSLSSGGKLKFGARDYDEIFAVSSTSSIPEINVSDMRERVGSGGARGSENVEYASIFGGFDDADVAMPYEVLFGGTGENEPTKQKTQAPISVGVQLPLRESSPQHPPKAKRSSNKASCDRPSHECRNKQSISVSLNQISPRNYEESNGKAHIEQLAHAVPGFAYFVNGNPQPQNVPGENHTASIQREVSRTWSFSGEVESVKAEGRSMPSHPMNQSYNMDKGHSRLPSFHSKDASERISGDQSFSFFDEEIDENSSAAASASELKKAVEQAQESIRLAKMLMERKREGLQDGLKPKTDRPINVLNEKNANDDNGHDYHKENSPSFDRVLPMFTRIDGKFAPVLGSCEELFYAKNVEVEKVRQADRKNEDEFPVGDKKLAALCRQDEKFYASENVESGNAGENIDSSAVQAQTSPELVASENVKTANSESSKVETGGLMCFIRKNVSHLKEMATGMSPFLHRVATNSEPKGPEVATDRPENHEGMSVNEYSPALKFAMTPNMPNELGISAEKDLLELEKMKKMSEDITELKQNCNLYMKTCDDEDDQVLDEEDQQWFESEEQLKEEEKSEKEPEIYQEVEVDVLRPNSSSDGDGQKPPGDSKQNESTERLEAAYIIQGVGYEHDKIKQNVDFQKVDGTIDEFELSGEISENQDNYQFHKYSCEKANRKAIDDAVHEAHNDETNILSCEVKEPSDDGLYHNAADYEVNFECGEENEKSHGTNESLMKEKEAGKKVDPEPHENLDTGCFLKSASEEKLNGNSLHNSSEDLHSNSDNGNVVDGKPEEMFEYVEGVNAMDEVCSSDDLPCSNEAAEFDLIDERRDLEQTSESEEGSGSNSNLESIDGFSAHEPREHVENEMDNCSTKDGVNGNLSTTACDEELVEEKSRKLSSEGASEEAHSLSNKDPEESKNSKGTESELERGQNAENNKDIPITEENSARGREHQYDSDDLRQRIEAIKRGRERQKEKIAAERAIREARERAFAEAQQRAVADAQLKLEKASAAKLKEERAAVERATAEARERALQKAMSMKNLNDARTKDDKNPLGRPSSSSRNSGLKHSFSSSDLDEFDRTCTESAQRHKAVLERQQRIRERVEKALAEKNKRDLLVQKEQAERNRIAEYLDAEIKRWSSGKEGDLRALLSTLQYILGPKSGWQPITLTEIVTTAAVKKAYRKATLYVHPDKLQQRGATVKQKYICEKVFDLLKAAWNRFNSEER